MKPRHSKVAGAKQGKRIIGNKGSIIEDFIGKNFGFYSDLGNTGELCNWTYMLKNHSYIEKKKTIEGKDGGQETERSSHHPWGKSWGWGRM